MEISLEAKAAVVSWLTGFINDDQDEEKLIEALEATNYYGTGSIEALDELVDDDFVPEFDVYRQVIDELGFHDAVDDATIKFGRDMLLDCFGDSEGDIALEQQQDGSLEAYRKSTGEVYQ